MADDVVESVKPNTDETVQTSSSGDVDGDDIKAVVKTFKDLVGLSHSDDVLKTNGPRHSGLC